ncbi:MBOAT family O-acyltransferase [Mucilaginibacter terrae]|uniref:MBOAT family O-acyltransferase n=1 Tax=Mucilaginibacter terrae TaxID=1955052 RepID=UPI0028969900|nr:MBOAT family O-acyltransferase [Mucilaginibacter terrae]
MDYYSGLKIHNSQSQHWRKIWLVLSVGINLGFLSFFKYYNFFAHSFADMMMTGFHYKMNVSTLSILLPVGISFYTFHGLSYVFDIYNRKIEPSTNFVQYSLFVSFFPLLVAGPIERATHLLPQVEKPRHFDYSRAVDGLRQILWGLFKKVVIADNCAQIANIVFNNSDHHTASALILGALMFTFQIYGDFSGYSDIALGTARLFGFELLRNFAYPYFSRDIAEFWRRWHISLSSWFKDYLYFPLGGSRGGMLKTVRNTFIIFLVSGFWHGANWTFVVWGGLNALFIMPSVIFKTNRKNLETVAQGKLFPNLRELLQMVITFALTVFAWIFFRAESLSHAFRYIKGIFSQSIFASTNVPLGVLPVLVVVFLIMEWLGRENKYAIEKLKAGKVPAIARWGLYYTMAALVYVYANNEQVFIYFQF